MNQDYHFVDQQLHWLSQTLAKLNRTFKEKALDDSHTNLYFDAISQKLVGKWIESDQGKFILSINLFDLSFELHDELFNSVWLVGSSGKSLIEIEDQLTNGIKDVGFQNENWNAPMPYEIPDYGFNKRPIERLSESQIETWSKYRAIANHACHDLLGTLQAESAIRIWPHHFDTGINDILASSPKVGFGLAMQDEIVDEAYFYLSANSSTIDHSKLSPAENWEWKLGDWKGATLRMSVLEGLNPNEALATVNDFSSKAIEQIFSAID